MRDKFDISRFTPSIQKLCKLPVYPPHSIDPSAEYRDHLAIGSLSEQDLSALVEIAGRLDSAPSSLGDSPGAPLHAWIALARFEPALAVPRMLDLMNRLDWEGVGGYSDRIWQMLAMIAFGAKKNGDAFDVVAALFDALNEKKRHSRTRIILLDAVRMIIEKHPEHQPELHQILFDDLKELRIGNRQWYAALVHELVKADAPSPETTALIQKACREGCVDLMRVMIDDEFNKKAGFHLAAEPELREKRDGFLQIYQIIQDLRLCGQTFPEAAIHKARDNRDLIIPTLIEVVRDATAYARFGVETVDGVLHFAVHLLGEFQAKEALPIICDSLSLDVHQCWDDLYGDSLYESLHGILYRLIGNDLDYYDRKIRDSQTPPVLRARLLAALPYLVKNDALEEDDYYERIAQYLRVAIDENNEEFVTDLICDIYSSGNLKYWPLAREAFDKGLVTVGMISRQDVESYLHGRPRYGTLGIWDRLPKSDFSDTITEMKWWAWFNPEPKRTMPPKSASPIMIDVSDGPPVLHLSSQGRRSSISFLSDEDESESLKPVHKVGRNDSCPCGSGKKYKKCCMDK